MREEAVLIEGVRLEPDRIVFKEQASTPRERAAEPMLIVYRTMANPAFVDDTIDPSPRDYGSLLSERPDLMNYAALGLAATAAIGLHWRAHLWQGRS